MERQDPAAIRPALRDIHRYWFGSLLGPEDPAKEKQPLWFTRSDDTDGHIREAYGSLIAGAAAADWDVAALAREEQVALVVLLDQFPRNIYRDDARAFAQDEAALSIARRLVSADKDRFFLVERIFLYLPFEHSERIADQDMSVHLFAELACGAPESFTDYARNALDYATKHRDLIRRFGRFPHRNACLGRPSTEEEEKFMAEHGRGF